MRSLFKILPERNGADKKFMTLKIGLFDSGIGGYSVLGELFKVLPEATYYYVSDDANAPYGPRTDEFITERSMLIAQELIDRGVSLIVVACNTATAASIDALREKFVDKPFVGVEPYLNAYYKIPEGLRDDQKKMMVLTTESTGKSERFKRLKERLDPHSQIDHFSLKNLARLIENHYHAYEEKQLTSVDELAFQKSVQNELAHLLDKHYAYAILGCTHYPLVRDSIETFLNLETISPDAHVAQRVIELTNTKKKAASSEDFFYYFSTTQNIWTTKKRESLYGPFKGSIR